MNPDSRVADREHGFGDGGAESDLNRPAVAVLDGVLRDGALLGTSCRAAAVGDGGRGKTTHSDEIIDHLLPQVHRNVHRLSIGRVVIAVDDELKSSSLNGVAEQRRKISRDGAELHGSELDLQLASFERRVVEELVDHVEQSYRVSLDERELLAVVGLQLLLALQHVLERAEDEGERCPELVGN